MRSPLASTTGAEARCVATVMLVLALAGCGTPGVIVAAAPIVVPLASQALDGRPYGEGTITAYMADGRVLEGNWNRVTWEAPAEAVLVATPDGGVTAHDLATPHRPIITATFGDTLSRMVCAYCGDPESGYRVRCADIDGSRWSGSVTDHYRALWEWSDFTGHVAVTLQDWR